MFASRFWNVLSAIIAAIVLGAIGSGVWESLLRPAVSFFSNFFLNIATLGISSYRDQLYQEIATGFHERAAILAFVFLLSAATAVSIFLSVIYFFIVRTEATNKSEDSNTISRRIFKKKPIATIMVLLSIVSTSFMTVFSFQINYMVRASSYVVQMETIIAPYIPEQKRLILQSQAAQVASKDDFVKVLSEMQLIAKQNGAVIPEFSIY